VVQWAASGFDCFSSYSATYRAAATANLQLVSVGVLEENGIITRRVFAPDLWAFQIAPAGQAHDLCRAIDFFASISPKGNTRFVRHVIFVFGKSKKLDRSTICSGFEYPPFTVPLVAFEAKRWQNLGIKFLGPRLITHTQIDVVEKARFHGLKLGPVAAGPLVGGAPGPLPGLVELSAAVTAGVALPSCIAHALNSSATAVEKMKRIRIELAL
jgi:hypothetical protein